MLVSSSPLARDWKTNEKTKDKPEDKSTKGKHAPPKKGIQTESKNCSEENKRGTKLDEQRRAREKAFSHCTDE